MIAFEDVDDQTLDKILEEANHGVVEVRVHDKETLLHIVAHFLKSSDFADVWVNLRRDDASIFIERGDS